MEGAAASIGHRRRRDGSRSAASASERGAALLEFAIVSMMLITIVFASLDYGRVARVQNQLSNAAREGGAIAQLSPYRVNRGCQSGANVLDRVDRQDPGLSGGGTAPGYTVTVSKRLPAGGLQSYTGCDSATGGVVVSPGDRVVVKVTRDITIYSPVAAAVVGDVVRLSRQVEVVVQG